jgi:hypothetical protein
MEWPIQSPGTSAKVIIKTIMVHEIVLKTLLFFAILFFKLSLYTGMDLVGGGGALVPTAELCWSCVPPAHQLLYLNCDCCSQFTYHHVITQITVSHFVFFALS